MTGGSDGEAGDEGAAGEPAGREGTDLARADATGAPFEDLVDRLPVDGSAPGGDPFDRLGSGRDRPPADGLWERVEQAVREPTGGADRIEPASTASTRVDGFFPSYPSRSVFVGHGLVTASGLSLGVAIYLFAVTGTVPEHLWILALPFAVVGIIGLLPILSWRLGIWRPRELK